jgi:hypothetical protein
MKNNNVATLNLDTMTVEDLRARFKVFGNRAKLLCGRTPNGESLGTATAKFFEELLDSTSNPEKIAKRNEFLERAKNDPIARQQLCAIRVETLSNYILASVNIIPMFFDIVNLADDERPVIQNTTEQEIKVTYVTRDGGVKTVSVQKDDDEVLVPLRMLTTDVVRYKRVDIYRGSIVDTALKVLRLAYDLANQEDAQGYTLLTGATGLGAFTFTGKKANYTYLANSRIQTGNLPTTNDIVLGDNSGATLFRYKVFRAAQKYADQWAGCFPEGNLAPTGRVLVPSGDASDIAEEILPSGNTNNSVADQLLETGYARVNYLGRTWTMIVDNTLPLKSCLVEYNRKPGRVYHKPSQDREVVKGEGNYDLDRKNDEERYNQKVFGAYIPSNTRVNFARIKFRT